MGRRSSLKRDRSQVRTVVFLTLGALFIWRYFRRGGGWAMLKMMDEPMRDSHDHPEHHHHHGHEGHAHSWPRDNGDHGDA